MPAPKEILDLVQHFESKKEELKAARYKEAQLREEFLNPFFSALGWDMSNRQGHAEAYKEVIHEDAIKIGAPDYCFRIGGVRKFFVEAKKPSVNIASDGAPAYQLRRYAWTSTMPLSILTDFEEFAVYDTRIRPRKSDSAKIARIMFFTYDQFVDKWDEIASIFSKEAILKGSFDKYAHKKKGGTETVDVAFLEEIESWRTSLAKEIAKENKDLSQSQINTAVQKIIDRIIFLRICEDRGIESIGTLQQHINGHNAYQRLCETFRKAEIRYDSGLFHFSENKQQKEAPDDVSPRLKIRDEVIQKIIKNLYYPESPYAFVVMPPEILGRVYEQFLGKVIELTPSHQAKVVEKPEVRKAGGVYYTPSYIVDYIVKNTVGKLVEGKKPSQVSKLTVVDPACGSGSFLIGAYQFLLDWHRDWYVNDGPEKWSKGKKQTIYDSGAKGWQLTLEERKRILTNNIYGVDMDAQAVEVTKLSLLLKVLEGETQAQLISKRVLPDLAENIKCGNSLIGWDYFADQLTPDEKEIEKTKPFDWEKEFHWIFKRGGFDVVIGNPPWGAELSDGAKFFLLKKYSVVPTKTKDSYMFFVCRALSTLRKNGLLGYLLPNTWMLINTAKDFRNYLLGLRVEEIIDHGDDVFRDAIVESTTLILAKVNDSDSKVHVLRFAKGKKSHDAYISKTVWREAEFSRIILDLDPDSISVLNKLKNKCERFEDCCVIKWGIKPYQVGHGTPPQTKAMLEKRVYHSDHKLGPEWYPLLVGADVNRYYIKYPNNQWIKYGKWLMYPSDENLMKNPKILLRQTSDKIRASLEANGFFCQNSVFIIGSDKVDLKFLLGLLNSKLFSFLYHLSNPQSGKIFAEIKPVVIKNFPICVPTNESAIDEIVTLVQRMLDLKKMVHESDRKSDILEKQIEVIDEKIDSKVYQIYGLNKSDIAIINRVMST